MKLQLLAAACLLLTCQATAQTDSLRKVVENYRGRSNVFLPNARQLLIDKLDSGLVEDVKLLCRFYMKELKGSDMQLFYNRERVLLSFYTGDVQPLLNYFAGGKSFINGGTLFRESHSYYSSHAPWLNDQLERVLFERTGREFNYLCTGLDTMAQLAPDDKDALQLYLRYLLPAKAGPAFKDDSVAYYAQVFLKQYPRSGSAAFVRNVILETIRPANNRLGLGINLGGGFIDRKLMNQFSNQVTVGAEMHVALRKYLLSLQIRGGANRLAKDVPVNNTVWQKNKEANILSVSALAGITLVNSRRFWVVPQIGTGYTFFKPSEDDIEQDPALKGASIKTNSIYPVAALLLIRKSKGAAEEGMMDNFFFSGLRLNYEWHDYRNFAQDLRGGMFTATFTFGMISSYKSNFRGYYW